MEDVKFVAGIIIGAIFLLVDSLIFLRLETRWDQFPIISKWWKRINLGLIVGAFGYMTLMGW